MRRSRLAGTKRFLLAAGTLYTLVFLICCVTPFLAPQRFLLLTYAAILFPWCFIAYIIWLVFVLLFYRKYAWIFLLLLLPAWKNANVVFSRHIKKDFVYTKSPGQIRILSWNVNGMLYPLVYELDFDKKQADMMNFIRQSNADVLCFQDYTEAAWATGKPNIASITTSLGYPYHYFSDDFGNYGTIIFSRLPIIDSGRIKYQGKGQPESLAFASVVFQGKTLRIYNTHLRSMFLHSDSLNITNVGSIDFVKKDTAFLFHTDRLERMAYFDRLHVKQAELIKSELDKTTGPYIFCADLNSVPSSYVYHHISKGLKDAFLQQGYGLGGTYHRFSFTLRIDVTLMSPQLKATQYYSPRPDLSDHYPLITDMQLQK